MNIKDLNFDTFQRFNAIRLLITLLPDYPNLSVLDVGGFPGTLADLMPEIENFITVDTHECDRKNYRKASGANLPFEDKSFDVVISSDTLEHVPAKDREAFLNELSRVCRKNIILGCPFKTKENEFAEKSIMNLYDRVFAKPNTWLKEHEDETLPDIDNLISYLNKNHLYYKVFPNGNVVTWYIMEALQVLLNGIPAAFDLFKLCNDSYNHLWSQQDNREPTYRKIFIASFDPSNFYLFLNNFENVYPNFDDKILIHDNEDIDEQSLIKLENLDIFINKLYDKIEDLKKASVGDGSKSLENYISQLEKIVKDEETKQKEIETLANKIESINNNIFVRILKKLKMLNS